MKRLMTALLLLLLLGLMACGPQPALEAPAESESAPAEEAAAEESGNDLGEMKQAALVTYADIVHASYEDSLTLAVDLEEKINEFVDNPSEDTHQAAKDAWLASNEPYGQTEAYRFYGGPIDDEDGPEGLLNAWPLDENYVDYVDGNDGGIINSTDEFPENHQRCARFPK